MKSLYSLVELVSRTQEYILQMRHIFAFLCLALLCLNFMACDNFRHDKKKDSFTYTLALSGNADSNQIADTLIIEVLDSDSEAIAISTNKDSNVSSSKPSILLFLQHDCKNCLALAPHIVDLKQKYAKFINLFILTSASQNEQDIQSIHSALNAYAKSYPIYSPASMQGVNNDLLSFLNKDISQGYVWLLDSDGKKVIDYVGLVPQEMLERDLLFVLHDVLNAEAQSTLQAQDLPTTNEGDFIQESSQDDIEQDQPKDSINPAELIESSGQNSTNPNNK